MSDPPPVRLLGDPVLRASARAVDDVHDPAFARDTAALLTALEEFRRRHGFGRAIAAPQIGVSLRVVAANLGAGPFLLVNPAITTRSDETFTLWDDCMSFPWLMVRLRRHRTVSLAYTDAWGQPHDWQDLDPQTSELMQHELDHLDGVLALDRAEHPADVVAREEFERRREEFAAMVEYTIPPLQPDPVEVRTVEPADREWVARTLGEEWGSEVVVAHGEVFQPAELPGFLASVGGEPIGLITFEVRGDECEIVSINALRKRRSVGTVLVRAVVEEARAAGCRRLFLITTNDNLDALRFYQRRGFRLAALRPGGVDRARELKPEISPTGEFGIPLRDELELEMRLDEP